MTKQANPRNKPEPETSTMMRLHLTLSFGIMLFLSVKGFAQSNYSIPIDSWTYGVIQQLQTRGYLLDLSPGFKPYSRMEVAKALEHLQKKTDLSLLPQADRWLIRKLEREFSYEIVQFRTEQTNPDTSMSGARIGEEAFLNLAKGDYATFKYAGKLEFRPTLRSEFGIDIGNHITLYTDVTANQTLKDDTLYTGAKKFGIYAMQQQAYIRYSNHYVDLTFGRDYLSWGYGNDGTVLISTTPGAFDMGSLFLKAGPLRFSWFVAQLDPMHEFTPDTNSYMPLPTIGVPNPMANRFLTGTRFEFNIADRVFLSVYQTATFGGPNASLDLEIMNPLRFVEDKQANSGKNENAFIGGDFSIFWPKNFNLYGSLMIDDWQVDHRVQTDLKPNLYAIETGLRVSNILEKFGVSGTDAELQYLIAGNRVYNEYNWMSYQKLLLRNYPVANPFGDDFWNVDLRLSHWFSYEWKAAVEFMHLEHGNSNIYSFYSMPWLTDPNVTVQTGYREPFPYGVIQETNLLKLNAMYQPVNYLYGSATVIYTHNRNAGYVSAASQSELSFLITFYYDFSHSFLFH